jgi:alkanesulfonate monooxygenase SsuD/methylene tetrahydromethanopterin reductase-like flavin-dependent oxidoreductase (luciferase family)
MTPMVGVFLPAREALLNGTSITELLDFAAQAEAAGFDSVWTGDSLLASPIPEPLTLLSAVAARTTRVTIGTAALLPVLRNPITLAHTLATLDRLALALGSGFGLPVNRAEFEAVGAPFDQRVGRLLETAEIWRRLWTGARVTFTGRHWTLNDISIAPTPQQAGGPPLWLATGTAAGARRAGERFDGILPYPPTAEQYRELTTTMHAAAGNADRDNGRITPALMVTVAINDDPEQARIELDHYVRNFYGFSLDAVSLLQACYAGPLDSCVDWLRSYWDAGARHMLLRIGNLDPTMQLSIATRVLDKIHNDFDPIRSHLAC